MGKIRFSSGDSSIGIACVYITSIIGAGFASGQEIFVFFTRYGFAGCLGLLVAVVLFVIVGAISVKAFWQGWHKLQCSDVAEFAVYSGKSVFVLTEAVIAALSISMLCVMISGMGSVCRGLGDYAWVTGAIAALIFLLNLFEIKAIKVVGVICAPIIVIVILYVCFNSHLFGYEDTTIINSTAQDYLPALWSALLYFGYNVIMPLVICSQYVKNGIGEKQAIAGCTIGAVVVGGIAFFVNGRLAFVGDICYSYDLPMLVLAQGINGMVGIWYGLVLWLAMISSAIGCAFAFSRLISVRFHASKLIANIVTCFFAWLLAQCGFTWLIENIYPALGIGGVLLVIGQIPAWTKHIKHR